MPSRARGAGVLIAVAEIMDLKRRWEEDKEKVEKLKKARAFRPY